MDFDQSLERLRALKNSKIPVQQKQGTLFAAIEATICQNGPAPAPAYFGALLSVLDQTESPDSVVYLLSVVIPFLSQAILVQKIDLIVQKIAPILTAEGSENSLMRSGIKVLESVLLAQNYAAWQIPFEELGPLRTFSGLIALTKDSRPKVRHQAIESIASILSSPPAGPKPYHPALRLAADSALEAIADNADAKETAPLMHALQFTKAVIKIGWPQDRYDQFCQALLAVTRTTDQYIVMAVFDIFEVMFKGISESESISKKTVLSIVNSIRELVPPKNDKQITPSWFAVLAQASAAWVQVDHANAIKALPELFETNIQFFTQDCPEAVIESSAQCLIAFIVTILTPEAILQDSTEAILVNLGKQMFNLLHVQYQSGWKEICKVYVAFLDTVSYKTPVEDAIRVVGVLRSDERLSASREATDEVLSAAIRAYGPEKLLELVPLQLSVGANGQGAGRAWMLPLLRDSIQNATIEHFVEYFIPLAKEFDEKSQQMTNPKNAKIVSTIRDQIWSLLPHYLDLPKDTKTGFASEFVQLLLSVLYEKIDYRTLICQSLKVIVTSNSVYSSGAIENPLMLAAFSINESKAALEYIAENFAIDILKALLNVYNTASEQTRPMILDTMDAYFSIISSEEISNLFNQISTVLFENLQKDRLEVCTVMLDVIAGIVPYLNDEAYKIFYNIFTTLAPRTDNYQIQKKIYGAFARLSEVEEGKKLITMQAKALADSFIQLTPTVQVPARRTRLEALHAVVANLSSNNLYVVPAILSEVMLCTKDTNEKTRETAYSLLALMGEKFKEGGVVDHSELEFLDDDQDVPATLTEFFTMVSAGLLGSTPQFISAVVLSLSFLFHEFYDDMDPENAKEIAETVWMFLSNNNREIVNSTLGFVKVSVLVLPMEVLDPHLGELVPNLLNWNKEHSNHFKAKVRHIFERLIRKVGYERLKDVFPEEHMKHLNNINKSRLRSKRKKAAGEDTRSKGRQFEDELDEALYASEDEEEEQPARNAKGKDQKRDQKKGRNNKSEQYIIGGGEPLDLMDQSALSRISSSKPVQGKKRELRHKLNERDGKIIIRDENDDALEGNGDKNAINAYLDAVKSGPVRTDRGKLKYKRGKRAQADQDDDDDSGDDAAPQTKNKKFRKMAPKPKSKAKPNRRGL